MDTQLQFNLQPERKIYSVSDLTARILSWLAPAPDTPRIPFA